MWLTVPEGPGNCVGRAGSSSHHGKQAAERKCQSSAFFLSPYYSTQGPHVTDAATSIQEGPSPQVDPAWKCLHGYIQSHTLLTS